MSSLPPGVTDSMCEPVPSECATCGHDYQDHEEMKPEACDMKNCDCESFIEGEYEPDYNEDDR